MDDKQTKFAHHKASVNNVRLHYVMGGSGEPVVLLHGWPMTWYEWHRVMPKLAKHYTAIAPDLRGMGDSEKPKDGYEKRNVAEDIYQLVQQLGYKQINLVGHDIGGMVAYAYAAAYPQTVRRLVMMECLLPGFGLEEAMDVARGGYWHFGFHMQSDIAELLVQGKEREYFSSYHYKGLAYNPDVIPEEDIDLYVRAYSAPGGLRGGFEHYRTLLKDGQYNRESVKTKLPMPVLTMGGEFNVGDRLYKSVVDLAENVRNIIAPHCGHWIVEEQPEFFIAEILNFLR